MIEGFETNQFFENLFNINALVLIEIKADEDLIEGHLTGFEIGYQFEDS